MHKCDYVICVSAPGPRWLSEPSDEDEPGSLNTTSDEEIAARYSHSEARKVLKAVVKEHPKNSFRIDVMKQEN